MLFSIFVCLFCLLPLFPWHSASDKPGDVFSAIDWHHSVFVFFQKVNKWISPNIAGWERSFTQPNIQAPLLAVSQNSLLREGERQGHQGQTKTDTWQPERRRRRSEMGRRISGTNASRWINVSRRSRRTNWTFKKRFYWMLVNKSEFYLHALFFFKFRCLKMPSQDGVGSSLLEQLGLM